MTACGEAPREPGAGSLLPPLAVQRLDGGSATLDEFAGRALVLNVWATWCPPCRAEMPSLQRLADAFPEGDLAVIGVSADDDLNLVREFVLQHRIRFPVVAQVPASSAVRQLGVTVFPTTVLVTRDRHIAAIVTGERDWSEERSVALIENLLRVKRLPGGRGDGGA